MSNLYHIKTGFPPSPKIPHLGKIVLTYTGHARLAIYSDKYAARFGGDIKLPTVLDLEVATPIEMEAEGNEILKLLFQIPIGRNLTLSLVVIPSWETTRTWKVKTVWLNDANDMHETLDVSRYVCFN